MEKNGNLVLKLFIYITLFGIAGGHTLFETLVRKIVKIRPPIGLNLGVYLIAFRYYLFIYLFVMYRTQN